MAPSYVIHVSGSGNVFMREIADLLVAALDDLGHDVSLQVDKLPEPIPGQIDLVVAPHELFPLLEGATKAELDAAAARSVCVGTEQPGTPWFEISARYMALGSAALDINTLAVERLRQLHVPVTHLPLGYHPSWDRWTTPGAPPIERSTDIVFLGSTTPRREAIISRGAAALAERASDLRFFESSRPALELTPGFLVGDAKRDLLVGAKVLLNVHRSEIPYFEWMRALEAMANGAVLVTEWADGSAPLEAGVHYVAADGDDVVAQAIAVADDDERRERMANAAHRFVRERLAFTDLLAARLPAIEAAVADQRFAGVRRAMPRALTTSLPRRTAEGYRALRHAVAIRVRGNVMHELEGVHRDLGSQLKSITLQNRRVARRLEEIESQTRYGDPHHQVLSANDAWAKGGAEVSVVIPLYNYANVVTAAIDSVAKSQGVRVELIVVDDHSTDRSRETASAALAAWPELPSLLIGKEANAGLSAARNTGFEHARADKVFLLDADNQVLPSGLHRLAVALDGSDAAFAYGIIARWGDEDSLVSHLPWSPERLCEGNYIDAMAMLRRSAWEAAGGYDLSLERLHGWEDYEMWLHLAALDLTGVLVTAPVARYWRHGDSMLAVTNLETDSVVSELRGRYPSLPWPRPAAPPSA